MTRTSTQDLQEEFLTSLRKGQKTIIGALRIWVNTVTTVTPRLLPLTDKLPKLPNVTVPFAGKLPTPEETVDSAYDLAEQLLANQRKFADDVLALTIPLMSGRHKNGTTRTAPKPEPKVVQVTPEPKPALVLGPKPAAVARPRPSPSPPSPSRSPPLWRPRRSPSPPSPSRSPPLWRPRRSPPPPSPSRSPPPWRPRPSPPPPSPSPSPPPWPRNPSPRPPSLPHRRPPHPGPPRPGPPHPGPPRPRQPPPRVRRGPLLSGLRKLPAELSPPGSLRVGPHDATRRVSPPRSRCRCQASRLTYQPMLGIVSSRSQEQVEVKTKEARNGQQRYAGHPGADPEHHP